MPRFGYHFDPPLATIPLRLSARDSVTFQTTLRNPMRLSKVDIPDEADQEAYRAHAAPSTTASGAAQAENVWGMVHASLITNIASPDVRIRHGSISALVGDANLAASLGMAGVCFHGGYQKGHDSREAALDALAVKLKDVLAKLEHGASVWLENGCEGTELGQTIAEIGQVVLAVHPDPAKFGIVLDTCHLHVAGFDLATPDAPQRLVDELESNGLTPYLRALHLNDAREACGSHRDRHATPGDGTIGEGLRHLCRHSLFAPLPAILELGAEDAMRGIAYLQEEI